MRITKLIPPIFIDIYKKIFLNSKNNNWEGNYNSWQEASQKCKGYDDDLIIEKVTNSLLKVKNGEAVYERDSVLFDKLQHNFPLVYSLLKIFIRDGFLNVIDFGGSLGSTYYYLKSALEDTVQMNWNIVEQQKFIEVGNKYFQEPNLNFKNSIEECLKANKCNVILLSSVLQYIEFPYNIIEEINSLQIENIIIDRTGFVNNGEDILTIQNVPESIYKASYPCWFLDENKMINSLNKNYKLVLNEKDYLGLNFSLNNNQTVNYKILIFEKI